MAKSSKGSQFERDVCRQLSRWWSKGQNENIFWRTSQSGGRMTTLSKKGKAGKYHHGDICAIDPIGQPLLDFVSIELKRGYKGVSVHDLLDLPDGGFIPEFQKWIDQAERERGESGSYSWLLITKRDRKLPLVFMPDDVPNALKCHATCLGDIQGINCMLLEDFLRLDPEEIKGFNPQDWCNGGF